MRLSFLTLFLLISSAQAGWQVNCQNHCAFSEFPNNCQGVFYQYPDGHKSYSNYSATYRGCYETNVTVMPQIDFSSHVLDRSAIQCNCPATSIRLPQESQAMTDQTRRAITILREQIRARTLCAPKPSTRPAPGESYAIPFRHDEVRSCFPGRTTFGTYVLDEYCEVGLCSSFQGGCNYHGDAVGGMGWLCSSGDMDRCHDIADSQDPQTGAWYRNNYLRRYPGQYRGQPYFSRDMGNGVMKYLLKTRDRVRAEKWLRFIANNPRVNGFYNLCVPPAPQASFVSDEEYSRTEFDNRCEMGPTFLGQLYRVLRHIGFSDGDLNRINSPMFQSMVSGSLILDANLVISAETVPAKGANAYQVALAADETMSRVLMGNLNPATRTAARAINERTSKINPRFHWIAQNGTATEYGAYLIQKYCKPARPTYGQWASVGNRRPDEGNNTGYWISGSNIDSVEYQYMGAPNSWGVRNADVGHECVGWINLYLGNADRNQISCARGETMIDGACQVISFPKAQVVPLAGLGYFLDMSSQKILYGKVNYQDCPYGGVPLPGRSFCELSNLVIPREVINSTKTYWVENSTSLMGLFTAPRGNGECSFNETRIGNICRAYQFPLPNPMLYPGINYSVSNALDNQGVFYQASNRRCAFGGELIDNSCWIYRPSSNVLNPQISYFIRRDFRNPGIFRTPDLIGTGAPQAISRPESSRQTSLRPGVSN